MKAFAIYGEQNSGKSTACFKVYELLKQRGATVIQSNPAVVTNPSLDPKKDFVAQLNYRKKTILITSEGDYGSSVAANIALSLSLKPDYFIFTIRKGVRYKASVQQFEAVINSHVQFLTIPKSALANEQNKYETLVATQIVNSI